MLYWRFLKFLFLLLKAFFFVLLFLSQSKAFIYTYTHPIHGNKKVNKRNLPLFFKCFLRKSGCFRSLRIFDLETAYGLHAPH